MDVKAMMCLRNDALREYCIVDDFKQENRAGAYIYDWAQILSELYDSSKEKLAKQIVDLLHAENFELNGIQDTLKDVFTIHQFVREIGNESLKRMDF